jgi:hypothetical protein
MATSLTPRQAGFLVAAFVLGGVAAVVTQQLVKDTGTNPGSETVALGGGTLATAPAGPVVVAAEVVRLPEGYEQRRTPEEPTLTLVEVGRVQVEKEGRRTEYIAGTSFFSAPDHPFTLRVLADARLSIVRLLSAP